MEHGLDSEREDVKMQYVSAEYVPSPMEGQPPMIKAIGDDGVEYWIPSADTDVPPWPEFLETATGKAFLAKAPPDDGGQPEPAA
jgi:hypothetical protein